jgi:hypothetical protein
MNEPRTARRNLQLKDVLARLSEPIRESPELEASLPDWISFVGLMCWRGGGETAR